MQYFVYTTLGVEKFDEIMDACPHTTRSDYRGETIFESKDSVRLMRMPLEENTNPFHKGFYSHRSGTVVDIQQFGTGNDSEDAKNEQIENDILAYLIPRIENPKIASCFDGSEITLEDLK